MATIRKRNGRWQVQVRRQGYPSQSKSFTAKQDAQTWARHTEAELDRAALPADPKRLQSATFGDLLDRYEREVTPRKRSAYAERSRIRLLKGDQLYKVSLAALTPKHVRDYLDRRLQTVCGETARKDGKLVRHVIETARRQWAYAISSNPAALVDLPPPCKPRTRRLTASDIAKITYGLKACRSPYLRAAIALAIETGMRRGELIAARWDDLDLERGLLVIPVTKTDVPRTIPLTPTACQIIRDLQAMSDGDIRLLPVSANALRLAWERLKRRAQIEDLRFHDLRHEAVSRFFELGLSVPEVALISGHRDPRMLYRYTHLNPAMISIKLKGLEERASARAIASDALIHARDVSQSDFRNDQKDPESAS